MTLTGELSQSSVTQDRTEREGQTSESAIGVHNPVQPLTNGSDDLTSLYLDFVIRNLGMTVL